MLEVDSNNLLPEVSGSNYNMLQVYNGLDCCTTFEIWEQIKDELDPNSQLIYNFERAQLGPAMDMMIRGVLVDPQLRNHNRRLFRSLREKMRKDWDYLCNAVFGKQFNIGSPQKVGNLLYDELGLPEQTNYKTDGRTTGREFIEDLIVYRRGSPFIKLLLAFRDYEKLHQVLSTGIDPDGKIRCSYNVGATETGRWSSSESVFSTGTNLQNITESLRLMLIAQAGYKMFSIDLAQAESRGVGYLAGDTAYIAACEGGDLHTDVSRMVYTNVQWPEDPAAQKALAEEKYFRHFSRRDLSKRGGHGSNYYGTARAIAMALKVPVEVGEEFQDAYFTAFPDIPAYHRSTGAQLSTEGTITTPLGRKRTFLGRLRSDATLREAIAYTPQSLIVDIVDIAMLRVFHQHYPLMLLQTQTHDSITGLYLEKDEAEVVEKLEKAFEVDVEVTDPYGVSRVMRIPTETSVGWNMGKFNPKNPDGLKTYRGSDDRTRQRKAKVSLLD